MGRVNGQGESVKLRKWIAIQEEFNVARGAVGERPWKGLFLKQPGRKIAPDELLISSGLIDSFSLVDLALFVEDTFNVHIDDTELNAQTFNSLNQLVAMIESRKNK